MSTPPRFLADLRARGVVVRAEGERLTWDAPAGVMRPAEVEYARRHKPELLELLRAEAADAPGASTSAPFWAQSESTQWYTPPATLAAVVEVLGAIDLDPAADPGRHVPAAVHFTAEDDGLRQVWHGRVFLNPPYDRQGTHERFVDKALVEWRAGRLAEAILLLRAGTDTIWFHNMAQAAAAVCLVAGRLAFVPGPGASEKGNRNTQGSVLFYLGSRPDVFARVFAPLGLVYSAPMAVTAPACALCPAPVVTFTRHGGARCETHARTAGRCPRCLSLAHAVPGPECDLPPVRSAKGRAPWWPNVGDILRMFDGERRGDATHRCSIPE
ncbi:MAG: hypothetical protein HY321_15210 [Armatimonadetes bacterium]|nr:hypothetical protein [Armatimonadota bacterium]